MFESDSGPLTLDLLVLPGATLMTVAAVIEPLRGANRLMGRRIYRWRFLTPDGMPSSTTSGIDVPSDVRFTPEGTNPLLVIASYDLEASVTPTLLRGLSEARHHRKSIGAIESGVLVLARAGLVRSGPVAVHWEDAAHFAAEFPEVVLSDQRYVVTTNRFTAGGAAPALEMMIELVRRRQGIALALALNRLFVYDPRTTGPGGRTMGEDLDPRLRHAVELMENAIEEPLRIAEIARRTSTSGRHLQTLYKQAFGAAPKTFYLSLRLSHARRLIIESRLPIASIAVETGFSDASAFSTRYTTHYNETPMQTRLASRTHTQSEQTG